MGLSAEVSLVTGEIKDICAQIAAGNPAAEAALHNQYWRGLVMILERRCHDPHLAEDLAQDTLFIVLNKLRTGTLNDSTRLVGFVHKTAKNCFANWQRKEWRRSTDSDTEQVERSAGVRLDPLRQLVRQESSTLVRKLVNSLKKDRDRDVLYRLYVLDQEKQQICSGLGLTPADFDRIISRARGRMRQLISQRLGIENMEQWLS